MATPMKINNTIYEAYGDRWYTAFDDPVALLRAETKVKVPWILSRLDTHFGRSDLKILDVGCGGGFVSNGLSEAGLRDITGVDISTASLDVARRWDSTSRVRYQAGDAYHLPFPCSSFDCVLAMDMLEHVEEPSRVIEECARVLRPGGLFMFQTINRNWVAGLVGIKFVEWFVRNTPKQMHLLRMFIKPEELVAICKLHGLNVEDMVGVRPMFSTIPVKHYFSRTVPEGMRFKLSSSHLLAYMGSAQKAKLHGLSLVN